MKWIKISDQVPDDYRTVLVYDAHIGVVIGCRLKKSPTSDEYFWRDEESWGKNLETNITAPTHWMPLPMHPNVEEIEVELELEKEDNVDK